jgi:hypothetical protein
MNIVCITPGPSHEYARLSVGDKWCFKCRKKLPHDLVRLGDPPDMESYYEPINVLWCSGCCGDYTRFPGTDS